MKRKMDRLIRLLFFTKLVDVAMIYPTLSQMTMNISEGRKERDNKKCLSFTVVCPSNLKHRIGRWCYRIESHMSLASVQIR